MRNRIRARRPSLESLESRSLLSAAALTLNVTTMADDPNGPFSGQTTLRDAITTADKTQAPCKIRFNIDCSGFVGLLAPLPKLTGNISISGPGALILTIPTWSQTAGSTGLVVSKGATVNLSGITLYGGDSYPAYGKWAGHCVDNFGTLTMTACTVTEDWGFGAVVNEAWGTMQLNNCTFSNNASDQSGATVTNWGDLTVTGGMFTYNVSAPTLARDGGAIVNYSDASITGATFTYNSAANGGAIWNEGHLHVSGCEFDHCYADGGAGGAIWNISEVEVDNSVFASNSSNSFGGSIVSEGTSELSLQSDRFSFVGPPIPGYDVWDYQLPEGSFNVDSATLANIGAGLYRYIVIS